MVREVDRALNKLANLSMDTLVFRLLPVFEINPEAFENPEDFETGLHPGKLFRRNMTYQGLEGIRPVQFQDVSAGAMQVAGILDRAHQEGALVSELQQSLPRYRGAQSATETELMQSNHESFFGSIATDIENQAIAPMVMMAINLIFQFVNTANDPRVASILGVDAGVLAGMTREEILELVQGEYKVHVTGLSSQLEKAQMLQNLVQFMNLIGQNPEAWLPYINQNELLNRILEAFRPAIHDLDNIVVTPEIAAIKQQAMQEREMVPRVLDMIPQLAQQQAAAQQQEFDNEARDVDQALAIAQLRAQTARNAAQRNRPATTEE
jgi:hypothetical protein